jgi:hypothetical protein
MKVDNSYLHRRVVEASRALPLHADAPVEPGDSVALMVATTIAGAAIDAVAPGLGLAFGLTMNFVGEPRHSTEVIQPDLQEAVYKDFFRRRPIQAFTPNTRDVERWNRFLREHWEDLQGHAHVPVPEKLAHPGDVGFVPTKLAAFVGQEEDWVVALPDRSRLHVHAFSTENGPRFEVHRDKLDPARGPIVALWHWFTETPEGQLTAGAGATVALAWWVLRDSKD